MSAEIMMIRPASLEAQLTEAAQAMGDMRENMLQMALLLRQTNERMRLLEESVRELTKVTPAQAKEINAVIRTRAAELCAVYYVRAYEEKVRQAIRKAIGTTCGCHAIRDLRRCDYEVALKQAKIWEDYGFLTGLGKEKKHE